VALAAMMIAAVVATRHTTPADSSPILPSGHWRTVWTVAVIAAFVLYGCGVLLARAGRMTPVAALVVAAVVQCAPLAAPLLLSRDVYLYWAESRVAIVHHANPYTATPSAYPDDPGTKVAAANWREQTSPYGPGWLALSSVPTAVAGSSHRAAEALYRVLAVLGMLAALALLARKRSASAVAFLGWSPLLALHFAGGGHSDTWIALALIVGVAFRDTAAGGASWALGSAIKPVPAILLPLELARGRLRFSRRFWIGLVGAGLAVIVLATVLFGVHWIGAAAVGEHGTSPIGGVHFLTETGLRHRYAVAIAGLVFVAIYLYFLRQAWQTGRTRLSLVASALCMCSSLLRPWYAIWPVSLAAVEEDGLAQLVAYALSAYVLFADAVKL
jgi:hypothetical protein